FEVAGLSAAVMAFAQAFTNAGSLEPQNVRDALAALDIETFFGAIKFDANGTNIAKPMVLYQVLDGRYKVVAPAATGEATLVFPRPDW
ncbi:MAG: ABC transporter substrate-binding protein, partial [Hyphomicrobiales bacterium]